MAKGTGGRLREALSAHTAWGPAGAGVGGDGGQHPARGPRMSVRTGARDNGEQERVLFH